MKTNIIGIAGGSGSGKTYLANLLINNFGNNNNPAEITPNLINATESVGWQLVVPDSSLIKIIGWGTPTQVSGNAYQYLNDQQIQNAVVYERDGEPAPNITIEREFTSTDRSLTVTFISKSTGAYKHLNISMNKYEAP